MEGYSRRAGMARGQGEMRDEPSRCAIYTRQSIVRGVSQGGSP